MVNLEPMREQLKEKFAKLFARAESEKIGIDVIREKSFLKSFAHVTYFTYLHPYVELCTEGISEHFLTVILGHELGHIEISRRVELNLGRYYENPLLHEKYAWKIALENESIEDNPELFELAQWQLNRALFTQHKVLNETTDNEAQAQEIERLNKIAKFTKTGQRL